jgi:hypothetical protein
LGLEERARARGEAGSPDEFHASDLRKRTFFNELSQYVRRRSLVLIGTIKLLTSNQDWIVQIGVIGSFQLARSAGWQACPRSQGHKHSFGEFLGPFLALPHWPVNAPRTHAPSACDSLPSRVPASPLDAILGPFSGHAWRVIAAHSLASCLMHSCRHACRHSLRVALRFFARCAMPADCLSGVALRSNGAAILWRVAMTGGHYPHAGPRRIGGG